MFSTLVTTDSSHLSEHIGHGALKKTHICYFLCLSDSLSLIITLGMFLWDLQGLPEGHIYKRLATVRPLLRHSSNPIYALALILWLC